jgi:cbb3-type cytochrome oxidase subunit 3
MPEGSHKVAKSAGAFGLLATVVSIWWFALRPRRKVKLDK